MANGLEAKEQIAPAEEEHDLPQLTVPPVANTENIPANIREEVDSSAGLEAIHDGMKRLLDTMSVNISLLEDSVREVRTARQIAAESNRMARRRLLHEGNLAFGVATK